MYLNLDELKVSLHKYKMFLRQIQNEVVQNLAFRRKIIYGFFFLIVNQLQRLSHIYCHCNWKFISAVLSMWMTRSFFCGWVIRPTTKHVVAFFPRVVYPKKNTRTRTANNGPSTNEEGTNIKAVQGMNTTKCLAFEY